MRKVALKCGIGLGTIYNYYPNKMDLIVAVIADFWRNCLKDFKVDKTDIDFFDEIEFFYTYILSYLEQFKTNWLQDLISLPISNKVIGKQKEMEFLNHFRRYFDSLIIKHNDEFRSDLFEDVEKDKLLGFIMDYFFIMLRRHEKDLSFFIFTLKKIML